MVDEVFLDYAHDGIPRSTFADNQDALTFTLSGLWMIAGVPRMKLGWIAVSGPEKDVSAAMQRLDVIADTYLSLNAPVQLAAATLLEQRKKIQPQLTHRVHANFGVRDRQLSQQQVFPRLAIEHGWYALLRVRAAQSVASLTAMIFRDAWECLHSGQ